MAEERQQQRPAQPDGRQNQPQGQQAGQASQAMQRHGGGQQNALARRGQSMPALFSMDPFDMLRTSPFAMMRRFTEEMDHLFAHLGMGNGRQGAAAGNEFFIPPVEVLERDGKLIVRADLPGLTKDDVRVEITDNVLTIAGERRAEHEERQEEGVLRSERIYGMFRRQIPLPEGVNADQATATFKDGVLEVSMPAPQQQTRGRQIEIQSSASSAQGSQESSRTYQEHTQTTTAAGS